jgi:hypothetical protein
MASAARLGRAGQARTTRRWLGARDARAGAQGTHRGWASGSARARGQLGRGCAVGGWLVEHAQGMRLGRAGLHPRGYARCWAAGSRAGRVRWGREGRGSGPRAKAG